MTSDRAAYVAGLRALADALEADEQLEVPHVSSATPLLTFATDRDAYLAWRSLLERATQTVDQTSRQHKLRTDGWIAGLRLMICLDDDVAFAEPAPITPPALHPSLVMTPVMTSS